LIKSKWKKNFDIQFLCIKVDNSVNNVISLISSIQNLQTNRWKWRVTGFPHYVQKRPFKFYDSLYGPGENGDDCNGKIAMVHLR
jgi:hypothetical protein